MLTALQNDKVVFARDAKKPGEFICPECGELVTLRKGRIKIHHFAHRIKSSCGYGQGESELHMEIKLQVYDALVVHPEVEFVAIETKVGSSRPDVFAVIQGNKVAFEIQTSPATVDALYNRTANYEKQGVSVLWILAENPNFDTRYRILHPSAWERWIHHSNSGKGRTGEIHFWFGDGLVRPFRYGNHARGTGKARRVHIVDDFSPIRLPAWSGGGFNYPNRLIWRRNM